MGGAPSSPVPGSALHPSGVPLSLPGRPNGRPAGPAPATGGGCEPSWLAPGLPDRRRLHAGPPSLPAPRLGRGQSASWNPDLPGPAEGGGCSGPHNPALSPPPPGPQKLSLRSTPPLPPKPAHFLLTYTPTCPSTHTSPPHFHIYPAPQLTYSCPFHPFPPRHPHFHPKLLGGQVLPRPVEGAPSVSLLTRADPGQPSEATVSECGKPEDLPRESPWPSALMGPVGSRHGFLEGWSTSVAGFPALGSLQKGERSWE